MDEFDTPSKFDLTHAEHKVIFSICDCSLDRKYSFYKLNKEQAKNFLNKLKNFEKHTWGQLTSLIRERGLTPEKNNSENFNLIHDENTSERRFLEQFYFHFRIKQNSLFRVFGYQKDQLFCITHIDPNGKINH